MVHNLLIGLSQLFTPEALCLLAVGMVIGMFVGMLPGMGVSLVLSLMLPFVYQLSVVPAVAMMLGTLAASYYVASITAILLNTPGAPESFPTTFDGFPMAQRGEAGRALAISASSTWIGGWIGCLILLGLLQVAGQLVGVFHPPEFAAVIILALVLIGGSGDSDAPSKVVVSGALGLMFSFVGSDPVTGVERFTFALPQLMSGLNVVPFALGMFAMTQMVVMFGRNAAVSDSGQVAFGRDFGAQIGRGVRDTAANWIHVVRSAVVAALLGLIPGIGGFSANFISYSLGRQTARRAGRFGTGIPAGVVSAEASSLAKEAGSLVPAVALGLPSGLGMVIFIAALSILGIEPGPTLLRDQPSLPYTMMWVLAIVGLLSCALGLVLTPWLCRVTRLRGPVLLPFILALAVLGAFASVTTFAGVVELGIFTLVGVLLRKLDYSLAALTIGLVLGETFANNVHLTQTLYGWSFFARSPLADAFLVIALALLVLIGVRGHRQRAQSSPDTPERRQNPVLEPVSDVVIATVSIAYFAVASGFPGNAGQVPSIVAAVAAVVALLRLMRWTLSALMSRTRGAVAVDQGEPAPVGAAVAVASSGPNVAEQGKTAPVSGASGQRHQAGPDDGPAAQIVRRQRLVREWVAIAWIWASVVACWLFGFEVGVPVVIAAYCLTSVEWQVRWQKLSFAAVATAVAFGIAYGFVSVFNISFSGVLG